MGGALATTPSPQSLAILQTAAVRAAAGSDERGSDLISGLLRREGRGRCH